MSLGRPLRAIHQNLKEIPMNKKIERKGERTRWRSALARKKERAPAKWWNVRPLTTSTKWKGGDDNYNDDGATRLQGNDVDYNDNDEAAAAAAAATRDLGENYCPFPVIPPDDRVRTITTTKSRRRVVRHRQKRRVVSRQRETAHPRNGGTVRR